MVFCHDHRQFCSLSTRPQAVTPVAALSTACMYRAAAFDVTGRKTSATLSDILRFTHKTARQETSKFYSDLRNASSLELTKYYSLCSAVAMSTKLSSYTTWSTSEMVASVQLPLNAVFFCLAEVVSHVILWRHCSRSIGVTTPWTLHKKVYQSPVGSIWWHHCRTGFGTAQKESQHSSIKSAWFAVTWNTVHSLIEAHHNCCMFWWTSSVLHQMQETITHSRISGRPRQRLPSLWLIL